MLKSKQFLRRIATGTVIALAVCVLAAEANERESGSKAPEADSAWRSIEPSAFTISCETWQKPVQCGDRDDLGVVATNHASSGDMRSSGSQPAAKSRRAVIGLGNCTTR